MPLTGDSAAFGNDGLAAAQLAADVFNAEGGRQVQIVAASATTPDEAQAAAKRLINEQHINILMGTTLSLLGIPASAEAARDGALYWDFIDVSPQISARGLTNTFQLQPHASDTGAFASDWIAQQLAPALNVQPSGINLGILYTNEALGQGTLTAPGAGVDEAKKVGLNIVSTQGYDPAVTDMKSIILKLQSANANVILASMFQPDAILFNKQARQLNYNPIVVDGLGYANPSTISALGKCINGVFLSEAPPASAINSTSLSPEALAVYNEYFPKWQAKTGRATSPDSDGDFAGAWAFFHYVLAKANNPTDINELETIARGLNLPLGSLPNGFGLQFDNQQHNTKTLLSLDEYQNQQDIALYPAIVSHGTMNLVPRPDWGSIC
jgi:branched-chain amino acid transport system substrate-binding protein